MRESMIPPPYPKGEGLELEEIKESKPFEPVPDPTKNIHRMKTVRIDNRTNLLVYLVIPFFVSVIIGSLIAYGLQTYIPTWFTQWWK